MGMIYILSGNDTSKRTPYVNTLTKNRQRIDLRLGEASLSTLIDYARNTSLFGDTPIICIESMIGQGDVSFDIKTLEVLKDSPTTFIFLEDKLLKKDETRYKKYATIESFENKTAKKIAEFNTFAIADLYGRRDKIGSWVLYREAIEHGVEPEAISGILFWKIKTMILTKNKTFGITALKNQSRDIVSLYHRAHRGESDFVIGLEQFILSSLAT
jgi:DNA polymerase III delta subunit